MAEITALHIAILAGSVAAGSVIGWIVRGSRCTQEKNAVSEGWQQQLEAQRGEHARLVDQNKGLMEQVSQFQASNTDAINRAKELSLAVQEAYERRDALQREIKDIRNALETTVGERDQLRSDMRIQSAEREAARDKDERLEKLSRELENWQGRLPPLIERFHKRNEEALRLEKELANAQNRVQELESTLEEILANQTQIEPVRDPEKLTDGLDASNDPAGDPTNRHAGNGDGSFAKAGKTEAASKQDDQPDTKLAPNNMRDNLKMIKGVGPAIEKTLNEMGIFRFQQIADMSEYDIDRVAKRLKGFRSRIYREDWIGQARELRDQGAHA